MNQSHHVPTVHVSWLSRPAPVASYVVVIHTGLFTQATGVCPFAGIIHVAPYYLASTLLLIGAGALSSTAETVLWGAAAAIQVATLLVNRTKSFRSDQKLFAAPHCVRGP